MTIDRLSPHVAISLALHAGVVLLIFFQAFLIPRESIDIRNAIRVDMVDLPRKMDAVLEPAPAPSAPEKVHELPKKESETPAKPEHKVDLKTKTSALPVPANKKADLKSAEKSAISKIKAMSAMDKIKQDVKDEREKLEREKQEKDKQLAHSKSRAEPVRGNRVSAGNSLTGLERIDYDRYFDELRGKVLGQFNLPQWLADQNLKAQALVLIDERGYITKRLIKVSSGNEVFDAKVLEAIDAISPVSPPPARLRGHLSTAGIVFAFPQQ